MKEICDNSVKECECGLGGTLKPQTPKRYIRVVFKNDIKDVMPGGVVASTNSACFEYESHDAVVTEIADTALVIVSKVDENSKTKETVLIVNMQDVAYIDYDYKPTVFFVCKKGCGERFGS